MLAVVFGVTNMRMVRGSARNVDKVVVTILDFHNEGIGPREVILETSDEIDEIFNVLVNTRNVRFHRHQKGYRTLMHDRRFRIEVYYSSGRIEKIEPSENRGSLFRNIHSIRGFLMGTNEAIWDFVMALEFIEE